MKNLKNKLFLTTAILALASCADNTYLGDLEGGTGAGTGAISFNMSTPTLTRAGGATAATSLDNNFVVFGFKNTDQKVFDNYQVNYVTSSANTTTSNSTDWEYVGYKNVPNGVTTNVGVVAFSALTGSGQANEAAIDQTIKYWYFAAGTTYNFYAYSLGTGTGSPKTYARASALSMSCSYTLTGSAAELGACYISKKKTISTPSASTPQVQLEFVNFLSKIQLKFYETIPGYAVKDLKFYYDDSNKTQGTSAGDGLKPALYGGSNSIMGGGKYTITFDTNGNPVVTLSSSDDYTHASKVEFDEISTGVWLDHYATTLDYKEAESVGGFLARESSAATSTSQMTVLPNSTGTALTLKIDYTLVSRDGTGETIQITGKTAKIPAQYTQWKSNFAYTYLFKITDEELTPITLDAVIVDTDQGNQETITTVTEPSITTFGVSAGKYVSGGNEYAASTDVYATVMDASALATLSASNFSIYDVTTSDATNFPVTEASVAEALIEGPTWTAAQAALKKITCAAGPALTFQKTVPAEDGTTITLDASNNKAAKFTTAATKKYALVYQKTAATYTTDSGKNDYTSDTFTAAGILYTDAACTTVATSWTSGTTYYKRTAVSNKGVYAVKIVTVP